MTIEGELVVRLTWDGERVREVAVRSTRPRVAARIVRGRSPRAAAELLSRVYSVCGAAQGVTAAAAMEAAAGMATPSAVLRARALAIRLEAIQEHCLRLGMDWPVALDEPPLAEFVRTVRTALSPIAAAALDHALERNPGKSGAGAAEAALSIARDAAADALFGLPIGLWLAGARFADLEAWSTAAAVPPARWYARLRAETRNLGASGVALMPRVAVEGLERAVLPDWRTDAFAVAPTWDGAPAETGALARMQGHPLVAAALAVDGKTVATRLVARLTELAVLLDGNDDIASPAAFRAGEAGYAFAHTARGLLVHRAKLAGDEVDAYAITAPTDWNFRTGGPLTAALANVVGAARDTVQFRSTLVARALDPCVACSIEVAHA